MSAASNSSMPLWMMATALAMYSQSALAVRATFLLLWRVLLTMPRFSSLESLMYLRTVAKISAALRDVSAEARLSAKR